MYVKLEMIWEKSGHSLAGHFPGILMDALGKTAEFYIYMPDGCQKEAFPNTNPENFCYRIPSVMKVLIGITRISCLGPFNVRPEVSEGLCFTVALKTVAF